MIKLTPSKFDFNQMIYNNILTINRDNIHFKF